MENKKNPNKTLPKIIIFLIWTSFSPNLATADLKQQISLILKNKNKVEPVC